MSASTRTQLRLVARGGAVNLLGAMVAAVSGFLLVLVVTNYFDGNTAGALFASTSSFLLAVTLVVFGTDTGLAHFLLRYEAQERGADIPGVLRSARRPVALVSVSVGAFAFAAAEPVADSLGLVGPDAIATVRILGSALPVVALSQLSLSETRALGRMRPTAVIDKIFRSGAQPLAALVVGAAGGGLFALTFSWVVPYFLAAIAALLTARRMMRRRAVRWTGPPRPQRETARQFWRYTAPRGVAKVSQMIIQRSDVILVGALLGVGEAAVYTAATRFVVVGQMSVQAIQTVLQPRFSHLLASNDLSTVGDVFKISTAWSMAVAWPIYVVTALAAPHYLSLFGNDYVSGDAIPVVVAMAFAMLLATAAGPLDTLLLMSGRSVASLINAGTAAVVNLVLLFFLIPAMGILGAALAWAVAILVRNAMTFVQVRNHLELTPLSRGGLVVAAAVGACFLVPIGALWVFDQLAVSAFLATGLVGAAAYLGVLWRYRDVLALGALRSVLHRRHRGPSGDVDL